MAFFWQKQARTSTPVFISGWRELRITPDAEVVAEQKNNRPWWKQLNRRARH